MKKKRKSIVPRKPDGSIDWKTYDKQLVQRSMEKFEIEYIPSGDKLLIRMIDKRGGRPRGGFHVRR